MPRTSLVLNFAFGAAWLAVCTYTWQLHEGRIQADHRQQELSTEVSTLKSKLMERDLQLAKTQAAASPSAPNSPASSMKDIAGPVAATDSAAFRARREALLQSPETQRLMQAQRRTALDSRFAWLFRKLNLPPAELERLKDLLVERQTAASDVYAAAHTVGMNIPGSRESLDRMAADAVAQVDNTIQNTFGDPVSQQFKQYEQTAGQRAVVGQLERRLSYTASPLTFDQAERLVDLLSAAPAATTSAPEGGFDPAWGPRGLLALNEQVIEQSRAFLSQAQIDAFREVNAQAELLRQFQARMEALTPPPANTSTSKL